MGTQTSFGGPGDGPKLLPKWATLPPDSPAVPVDPGVDVPSIPKVPSVPGAPPGKPTVPGTPTLPNPAKLPTPPLRPSAPGKPWRSAGTRLGAAVTKKGRGSSFRRAGRAYVRAMGGSKRAASSARSGRGSTASLGGFLAAVANRGVESALRAFKLSSLVGKDPDTVFAAIVNAIAPEGSSREEIAARDAVSEALCFLYEKLVTGKADLAKDLGELDQPMVEEAVVISVTAYVYERWLVDLGKKVRREGGDRFRSCKT